jgi:hypothetical protein
VEVGVALPNFFILGAGRSGTTSLSVLLRRHPDIFIPEIKEPSFFAESFQWIRSPVRYADLYADAEAPLRGDASHIYLEDPTSARTLKAFAPDAKFVVVLRNPADRARALYSFMVEHGYELLPTMDQALAAEDRRFASERFRRTCPGSFWNFMYFRSGLYAEQIERYFALFPRDRFFITTLPDLITRPDDTVGAMCEFLGATPMAVEAYPRDGTSKGVRSTAVQVAARKFLRPLAKRNIPATATAHQWVREHNRAERPVMSESTRRRLLAAYEPDLARLAEMTGIDFRGT